MKPLAWGILSTANAAVNEVIPELKITATTSRGLSKAKQLAALISLRRPLTLILD